MTGSPFSLSSSSSSSSLLVRRPPSTQQQQQQQQSSQKKKTLPNDNTDTDNELQIQFQKYASQYPITLIWPPKIIGAIPGQDVVVGKGQQGQGQQLQQLRTSRTFVEEQLKQSGLCVSSSLSSQLKQEQQEEQQLSFLYDPQQQQHAQKQQYTNNMLQLPLQEAMERLHHFVQLMEGTDCYHKVHVQLHPVVVDKSFQQQNQNQQNQQQQQQIWIVLEEKNWYRLHAGASIKPWSSSSGHDMDNSSSSSSSSWWSSSSSTTTVPTTVLPTTQAAQVELSAGIRNIFGICDITNLSYTVEAHPSSIPSWSLTHVQPSSIKSILSFLEKEPKEQEQPMSLPTTQFTAKAFLTTQDYETTRSYKEYQRGFYTKWSGSWNINNDAGKKDDVTSTTSTTTRSFFQPQSQQSQSPLVWSFMYEALLRDIIPKRLSTTTPYIFQASLPILQQAGPTWKQSIIGQISSSSQPSHFALSSTNDDDNHDQQHHHKNNHNNHHHHHHTTTTTNSWPLWYICPYWDWTARMEWALPTILTNQSDLSFVKTTWNINWHCPLVCISTSTTSSSTTSTTTTLPLMTWHSLFNVGHLYTWTRHSLSDRFYVGGPLHFRGFGSCGIGPRASWFHPNNNNNDKNDNNNNNQESNNVVVPFHLDRGDALGGDFYYTWTQLISFPLLWPWSSLSSSSLSTSSSYLPPIEAFVFGTVGTCVGSLSHVFQQQQQQLGHHGTRTMGSTTSGGSSSSDDNSFPSMLSSSSSLFLYQQLVQSSPYTATAMAVAQSSRVSIGCGLSTNLATGASMRLEGTYSIPLRYGPYDIRRNVQWGIALELDR